jgi:hypothetical protein
MGARRLRAGVRTEIAYKNKERHFSERLKNNGGGGIRAAAKQMFRGLLWR